MRSEAKLGRREELRRTRRPLRKAWTAVLRGTPLLMSKCMRNLAIEILIDRHLMTRRIWGGKGKDTMCLLTCWNGLNLS